ncbi:MAG: diguanylate cyclase [Lachnospiraceae bacterium]|nr:diguanylate cyclase [Lachnospiraceae bacterium]
MKIPPILRIYLRIYLFFLILLLGTLLFFTDFKKYFSNRDLYDISDFSTDWTDPLGNTVDLDDISAGQYGGEAEFTKKLPELLKTNEELCFICANANVMVFVDDKLCYEYRATENTTGMGYGKAYNTVNLGPEDSGLTVRIKLSTVFDTGEGGHIGKVAVCEAPVFRAAILKGKLIPFVLSVFITMAGILIMIIRLGIPKNQPLPYNLVALGVAITLAGIWCIGDTSVLQVIFGHVGFWRVIEYSLLIFSITPWVSFVISLVKIKRGIFVHFGFILPLIVGFILLSGRFVFGMGFERYEFLIYLSYILTLIEVILIAIDNERYCKKTNTKADLGFFYIGGGAFILGAFIDICIVFARHDNSLRMERGYFTRIGICVLVVMMIIRVVKWWSREQTSIGRDRFVNAILQYSMSSIDSETKINLVLEYMGKELKADRTYIFEEVGGNLFDNTYEWCKVGVTREIHNLKGLPYDGVVDVWYEEYKRNDSVIIYDLEEYKNVSINMYNVLKPQGINTLITAPLSVNGKYIGFFGVDNPPAEMMTDIREVLRLLAYFMSQLIVEVQYEKRLIYYSYYDSLTGVKNRRAIEEFEKKDFNPKSAYGFIMCDVNGLKIMNDTNGHEAGDTLLKDVAGSLAKVFGLNNVFRVGGDEFAVYDCESDKDTFLARIAEVRRLISELGRSVSLGHCYNDGGDTDYEKIKTQADQLMYEEKRRYYEGRNNRRH